MSSQFEISQRSRMARLKPPVLFLSTFLTTIDQGTGGKGQGRGASKSTGNGCGEGSSSIRKHTYNRSTNASSRSAQHGCYPPARRGSEGQDGELEQSGKDSKQENNFLVEFGKWRSSTYKKKKLVHITIASSRINSTSTKSSTSTYTPRTGRSTSTRRTWCRCELYDFARRGRKSDHHSTHRQRSTRICHRQSKDTNSMLSNS